MPALQYLSTRIIFCLQTEIKTSLGSRTVPSLPGERDSCLGIGGASNASDPNETSDSGSDSTPTAKVQASQSMCTEKSLAGCGTHPSPSQTELFTPWCLEKNRVVTCLLDGPNGCTWLLERF